MMYRHFLTFVICINILPLFAQTTIGIPDIVNYQKGIYNAGTQNWDIRQDVRGCLYFANNEGLLSFDGTYWKLYPLPNKTIVRSVEIGKDKRIYVGGQDEIGYYAPDKNGKLSYISLKDLLPESDKRFADIWDIVSFGDAVFFRSTSRIFQLQENKVVVHRPTSSWTFMGSSHQNLFAQDAKNGMQVFKNGTWVPLEARETLPVGFTITGAAPMGKDSTLFTSTSNGLFIYDGETVMPFHLTGREHDFKLHFSAAIAINEKTLALGTYNNGCYIINNEGHIIQSFSTKSGLHNNNVRSIYSDKSKNLWLGLDNGVDFIAFDNAVKRINPPSLNDGAGYASVVHNNQLYFGLSNGIYYLPLPNMADISYAKAAFKPIANMEGQIWGLSVINNHLLAGRDAGAFLIQDNMALPLDKQTGFWTFQPLQGAGTGLVVAGNYQGLQLMEYSNNTFLPKAIIPGLSGSARFISIDKNGVIWTSHPYRGVYKIEGAGTPAANVQLYTHENGLPSSINNHVYKVKNKIVVATEKGVYEYNSRTNAFEKSAYYEELFGNISVRYLKEDPNGNIWFIHEKNLGVVDFAALKPQLIYLPELNGKMVSGFEHVYPMNEQNILIGAENGFYHINYEKYKKSNHGLSVYIRTVVAIGKSDSLLFGGYFGAVNEAATQAKDAVPTISHQWNSFHIEYSSPLYEQQSNIEYSYYLEGFDKEWADWSKKTEKDYTNLPAGAYTFHIKARNNLGNASAHNSYAFTVLPPWYETAWAYSLYVLLACGLGYLLYKRQKKQFKLQQQKHLEEQQRLQYLHQLELEKSEKEIVKLRNEKLESEIEFKNSELASSAMHLVQKGELLTKIKDELQRLNKSRKDDEDVNNLKKIIRILSEEEKMNEDWEQFAVHFNKVHSNFLLTLKEKYPNLSAHELKLCAYLRMNLTSKEIAQLMNISVRGVEISRYRLRKKLQLPTEVNLFQFLLEIHSPKENLLLDEHYSEAR